MELTGFDTASITPSPAAAALHRSDETTPQSYRLSAAAAAPGVRAL
jgi:hypothetical protein